MKMKTKTILRKLGMLLAVALLFTALAVPAWAAGSDAEPVIENYEVRSDTHKLYQINVGKTFALEVTIADQNATEIATVELIASPSFNITEPKGNLDKNTNKVKVTFENIIYTGGDNNKLVLKITYNEGNSLSVKTIELPIEECVTAVSATVPEGAPAIVAYTVTDAGNGELQRIEPGQKCTIIVAVVDPRITDIDLWNGSKVNIKITSTASFASPTLGDIYAASFDMTSNGLKYAIVLNDITYRGGDNTLALDIAYEGYQIPLPLASVKQPISQCYDAQTVEEPKDSALVLTSASYGGGSVEAGRDFTLTVDVLAPAKYAGAENVKVIITPPEQFTASSGSTMIYVGDLAPGASRQVTFELNASAVAPSGSYSINVSVSGTAANGAAPSDQMSVTVPVTQPERFEISRTDLPEYLSMGEEGYAYVSFVNKGKGTIYNVSAEITGDGITTTEGNQYIGNVPSGTESSADFTIQTSQAGNISALLTITYEDEKGNIKTLTKDFTMTVEEMYMGGGFEDYYPEDFGDMGMMPEENTGIALWVWILIALGVLAAGGGVAFFLIKKKKAKQKAAQLTEDDDEDI